MKKYLSLENLIYLTVFFLPIYIIKVKIFVFPTNLLEIMIGVIFLFWIWGKGQEIKWQEILSRYKKYILSLSLIFIGLFASIFFNSSSNYLSGAGIIKGWFFLPLVFTFISINVLKKEQIKNIFLTYFFSASIVAIVSFFFLFFNKFTYDGRLQSFFNSPNYLAMYLCPGIIIGIFASYLLKNNIGIRKNLFITFLLIILVALYFTYSYAAWISVGTAFTIASLTQSNSFLKKIGFLGIIFIFLIFSQLKNDKLNNFVNLSPRSSIASRVVIWKSASRILKNNWMWGIGPGNFQKTYLDYQKYFPPYLEWAVPHPHNLFLSFWLSGGIPALAGFLSLIFFWFQDVLFRKNKTFIELAALGIMIYILLHGLIDTTYFKNDLAIVFWLTFLALKK